VDACVRHLSLRPAGCSSYLVDGLSDQGRTFAYYAEVSGDGERSSIDSVCLFYCAHGLLYTAGELFEGSVTVSADMVPFDAGGRACGFRIGWVCDLGAYECVRGR